MTFDDDSAVAGGPASFIQEILNQLPDTENAMVTKYVREIRAQPPGDARLDTVPLQLSHLFGDQRGKEYWARGTATPP